MEYEFIIHLFEEHISIYVCLIVFFAYLTFLICRSALNSEESDFVKKWSSRLNSGYGNVLFAMVSILWASSVSVFGADIKGQVFDQDINVSWETLFFFTSVFIAVVLGIYHYIGQQKKEREAQSRPSVKAVQLASKDIIDLNQALSTCVLDWEAILVKIRCNKLKPNELDAFEASLISAKKQCLKSLLNISSSWDDKNNHNVVYRANIFNMVPSLNVLKFLDKNDIVGPKPRAIGYNFDISSIVDSPFFLFNDNWRSRLEKCDYILVNEQNLSVSLPYNAKSKVGAPICMPYSDQSSEGCVQPKQPNLHGAPLARKFKRPVYIQNLKDQLNITISDLSTSPAHKNHMNERFKQDLYEYYEKDSTKSILSIPIYKYDIGPPFNNSGSIDKPKIDNDLIICVVNIYANRGQMFSNDDMANAYCDTVQPITYILSVLISMRFGLITLQNEFEKINHNVKQKVNAEAMS